MGEWPKRRQADHHPIKTALNNGLGTWLSRCILAGLAGMAAWSAMRTVSQLDGLILKVDSQHEDTVTRLGEFNVRLTGAERDIVYMKERR